MMMIFVSNEEIKLIQVSHRTLQGIVRPIKITANAKQTRPHTTPANKLERTANRVQTERQTAYNK
jgi:hypothetical protein